MLRPPARASGWRQPQGLPSCVPCSGAGVSLGSSAGSPPPRDPALAVLTADDVSISGVEVVGGDQGSALALSQPPVAAVVGMAAPTGDTTSNRSPPTRPLLTGKGGEGREGKVQPPVSGDWGQQVMRQQQDMAGEQHQTPSRNTPAQDAASEELFFGGDRGGER